MNISNNKHTVYCGLISLLFSAISILAQPTFAGSPVPTYKAGCDVSHITSVKITNQLKKVVMNNTVGNMCGTAIPVSAVATLQANYGGEVYVKASKLSYAAVYVDWNRDNFFNNQTNEFFNVGEVSKGGIGYISVPADAIGTYVMRVVTAERPLIYTGGGEAAYAEGETEVYNLKIVDCNPTIVIPSNFAAYCAGNSILLNGSGAGSGGQHIWNASDGGSGTFTPVNKTDSVVNGFLKGTPTVSLTVINKDSTCRNFIGRSFNVNPQPYPVTVLKPNRTAIFSICNGSQTTLTALPYGKDPFPLQYQWFQEKNGLLKGRTFDTLNATQSGRYFFRANLEGYNCGYIYSDTVTVNVLPSPVITITSNNLCAGTSKLTATSPTNALYGFLWYADRGNGFLIDDKYRGQESYFPDQDGKILCNSQ